MIEFILAAAVLLLLALIVLECFPPVIAVLVYAGMLWVAKGCYQWFCTGGEPKKVDRAAKGHYGG